MPSLQNKKVIVLYGGISSERAISLKSGQAVIASLQRMQANVQAIDVNKQFVREQLPLIQEGTAFIMLHGGDGEDGTVQAVLDMAGIPYTGSGMAASSLAMSKWRTKQIWQSLNLPTPAWLMIQPQTDWQEVSKQLGAKVILKPASEGSSIGMAIAQDRDSFIRARDLAFQYDRQVLAEQWIEGEEYTVSILSDKALPAIQLRVTNSFYDYQAKYESDETEYESDETEYICPCGLEPEEENKLQQLALAAFRSVGAEGWGRVDVMRDPSKGFLLLEVNTVPGMTDHSLVPMAAQATGMDFDELVYTILQSKEAAGGAL
jgi:D-alanine-D-alanine ligase